MELNRRTWATGVGGLVLLLLLSHLARTEMVLGSFVQARISAEAKRHGIELEIDGFSPAGFTGLSLEGVAARIPAGKVAVEVDVDRIDIYPRISSLLVGVSVIDEVVVRSGTFGIRPWEAPAAPPAPIPATKTKRATSSPRPKTRSVAETRIALHDIDVRAISGPYASRPLRVELLEAIWRGGRRFDALKGFGAMPDGVAFAANGGLRDGDRVELLVEPETATRLDRWLELRQGAVDWPVSLAAGEVQACLGCLSPLTLRDVEIGFPVWRDDVRITAPEANVVRAEGRLELDAPEMAIIDATTRDFSARLIESRFAYHPVSGDLSGRVELADPRGGKFDTAWDWDGEDFDVRLFATNFELESVWHLLGGKLPVEPSHLSGSARLSLDLVHETAEANADLVFDELRVRLPFGSNEALDARQLRARAEAFADLRHRAVSVRHLSAQLGSAGPFVARGSLIDAGSGWDFDGRLDLESARAEDLRLHMPRQLTAATDGAVLEGSVSGFLAAKGHTAFPDELVLDGALESDVTVVQDGPAADVAAIGPKGPPPSVTNARIRESWVDLQRLPELVPQTVLAAEDAQFYRHHGFDWPGLQAAMKDNLRARGLKRGGSTVSQQVAKNLFLTGERTLARKLQEAYLTWRLESQWPKDRILEIYLNIANWGPGTFGIAAAAQRYFRRPVTDVTVLELALLASILPNPARYGGWIESGSLASSRLGKVERVLRNLRFLGQITADDYRSAWSDAQDGKIGGLELRICDDDGLAPRGAPKCPPAGTATVRAQ